jgi:hypothetical protein
MMAREDQAGEEEDGYNRFSCACVNRKIEIMHLYFY